MNTKARHSRQVWENFWQEKKDINQVYANSDRIIRQIEALGDLNKKIVMEIGAGSGRDGFRLVDKGALVILLDYAENSLLLLQQLSRELGKPVVLLRADAFHLPFRDNSLDLVYHQGLLEHFTNPEDLIQENYRVLKSGGHAIADVPQRYHLYTLVKHVLIWMNKWFAGWETEFSIGQLRSLFTSAGFSIHAAYGDWMRPGFCYRALREVLKKFKIVLPLYPRTVPLLSPLCRWFGNAFKRCKPAFYTFMDIGVIGKK
ncbi:MAG TPA: class I SAM-dependent methyltransferase [bacterium]|nr:class I SAM-dependent methyltransferase [bacterium]HPN43667.1 class I SAM-dependent methyltransferase [bacterium]